jgi:phosphoribosyl 1,2-cyclic phosphate phosphodiesterase
VRLRFLGTGTSFGVPVVGCECPVCTSDDPRNRRYRHCLTVEEDGRVLLIDTPPELRLQLLAANIGRVDAVYLTHLHADHVHGIDDLRIFSMRERRPLPMFVAGEYEKELRERFDYIFDDAIQPQPETSAPDIMLSTFDDGDDLEIAGFPITPLAFPHGKARSFGFRTGRLGVIVDGKQITEAAAPLLDGVDVLVINALWWGNPHPTHFNVEEALAAIESVGARRAYLTHMTHRLEYRELLDALPAGVEPAYDGLVVDI